MRFWKQFQKESLEKEIEARAHVRELELYVTHLEQYNTVLHEEVHRLNDPPRLRSHRAHAQHGGDLPVLALSP
jgi:hypothetical protein